MRSIYIILDFQRFNKNSKYEFSLPPQGRIFATSRNLFVVDLNEISDKIQHTAQSKRASMLSICISISVAGEKKTVKHEHH